MKLTAQQIFDATPVIATIIREQRPMPQKGAYRLARMYQKLKPEYDTINQRRDALILPYDFKVKLKDAEGKETGAEANGVPADKDAEFQAAWKQIADEEIEVPVEPIPLAQLDLGDDTKCAVRADELVTLFVLVAE